MNSDLTPASNVAATDNPQAIYSSANGVNSSYLQQGAGLETLRQNYQLSVVQTGEPIEAATLGSSTDSTPWVAVIIGLVLLAAIVLMYKRLMNRAQPAKEEAVSPKVSKSKSKKKQPRSKRHS
jgi:hypothetical protein